MSKDRQSRIGDATGEAIGGAGAKKATRSKMNYYADASQDGRIRAAYYAGRDKYGWRNMTEMQLHGVMGLVESLERDFNNGEHFTPMPPGTGPVGRPLGMKATDHV